MKKIKKIVAAAIGALMSVSVLAGCSASGLALYQAHGKLQKVKSMETKTDISFNISASNLSPEEQGISSILPVINASKISVLTKSSVNDDKTSSKLQSDISIQLGENAIKTTFWSNTDFSNDKKQLNQIIRIPEILKTKVQEAKGKDYLVMDFSDMMTSPGTSQLDYKKLIQLGKEFEPKLNQFIESYVNKFNPELNIISSLGKKSIEINDKKQSVDVYELKLDDKGFKDLAKYTVNNLGDNKDLVISFLRDYLLTINSAVAASGQKYDMDEKSMQELVNRSAAQFPEVIEKLKQAVNSLDNVKILGSDGVSILYSVDDQGYIVNTKGSVQFLVDAKKIMSLISGAGNIEGASAPSYTGLYTITVNFNTDRYNINEAVNIEFPVTNDANSISFVDLLKVKTAPTDDLDTAYKNAYTSVQRVVMVASQNNVKPSFFKIEGSLEPGANDSQSVARAALVGLQRYINDARKQINDLPDTLLNQKQTLSSILDNYQNPIYERTVYLINSNKTNPKQDEIIMMRVLINDMDPYYRLSYSRAVDEIQAVLLKNASDLVDKAAETKAKEDIDKAHQAIQVLKTIPANFLSDDIANFIKMLEDKLKS